MLEVKEKGLIHVKNRIMVTDPIRYIRTVEDNGFMLNMKPGSYRCRLLVDGKYINGQPDIVGMEICHVKHADAVPNEKINVSLDTDCTFWEGSLCGIFDADYYDAEKKKYAGKLHDWQGKLYRITTKQIKNPEYETKQEYLKKFLDSTGYLKRNPPELTLDEEVEKQKLINEYLSSKKHKEFILRFDGNIESSRCFVSETGYHCGKCNCFIGKKDHKIVALKICFA